MSRLQSIGVVLIALPLLATAQDSAQVARLDQEVRQLQREVGTLTQLVNQLRNEVHRAATTAATAPLPAPAAPAGSRRSAAPAPAADATARWIDAGRWQRLKPGMSELEVIGELGAPTSIRSEDGAHILLYALELGPGAFLAGSVRLRDQVVTSIEIPALK